MSEQKDKLIENQAEKQEKNQAGKKEEKISSANEEDPKSTKTTNEEDTVKHEPIPRRNRLSDRKQRKDTNVTTPSTAPSNASFIIRHMESFDVESEEDFEENMTCCHRATWCPPILSDLMVNEPIFNKCCPKFNYSKIFFFVTVGAVILMCYTILYFYIGDSMLPGGNVLGLFLVMLFVYLLGWGLAYLPYAHLPPFFGMLLAGIIVRNAGWYNIEKELDANLRSKIRTFSTTFVMLRAGLQLTSSGLWDYPLLVLNLAIVPCSLELVSMAVFSWSILGYSWAFAFLTGSIIACLSPVVPVNCILALANHGYGQDKEIATLLVTAASIDDIHIMSMYGIVFAIVFADDHQGTQWWSFIPGGLRDFILGLIIGTLLGIFFVFFPHRSHKYAFWYRISCLILGSLMCTNAPRRLSITGGSFLAVVIMSLISTTGWRILSKPPFNVEPLRKTVALMWHFMQPVLVGVMAADLDFHDLPAARTGLYLLCIFLALIVRIVVAYFVTYGSVFNSKERLFISLSWFSKGTLQAVLGSMVLEQAKANQDADMINDAIDVIRLVVIAIVMLAPTGALVMMFAGPKLLNKTSDEEHRRRRELSYLRIMSLQPVRKRRATPRKAF